jgi:tetratricopeptide (TPR) repeat protein
LNRDNNDAYFNRAELHAAQNEWKEAVADYNEAIRLAPQDAGAYANRADANMQLNNYKQAVLDFTKAIELRPDDALLHARRATIAWQRGEYPLAVVDYRIAMMLDNKLGPAYIGAAWLMATCGDSRYREPVKSLQAAEKAIEFDGDKDYRYLDTLAAAQAANGKFEEAAATQQKAIAAAPQAQRERQQKRLELYKAGKPYYEGRAVALPSSIPLPNPAELEKGFDDEPVGGTPPPSFGNPGSPANPGFPGGPGAERSRRAR